MAPGTEEECPTCRLPLGPPAPDQRNRCPFCRRSFPRADAATRHARTCRARGDRPLPATGKRGRKLRACDLCFRIKVSCDAKTPACGRCSARGLACVYGRVCSDFSHRSATQVSVVSSSPHPSGRSSPGDRLSVPFLLNCTNPSVSSVNEILACEPERGAE
jgi:hypothetical protein